MSQNGLIYWIKLLLRSVTTLFFILFCKKLWNVFLDSTYETKLYLPRFKRVFGASLKNALIEMGLKSGFEPGSADFNEISGESLYMDDVIHKVVFKVSHILMDGTTVLF